MLAGIVLLILVLDWLATGSPCPVGKFVDGFGFHRLG
jgi:hypothetical protein